MLNKELNGKLASIIIIILGLVILAYSALQINWADIELSFKSVVFPILLILIIALFAFKVASNKDIDITSEEIDKKISKRIDGFNHKTRYLQGFIIGIAILVLLVFYFSPNLLIQLFK